MVTSPKKTLPAQRFSHRFRAGFRKKLQEPGEMAAPGKPILLIKDPDNIEISAYLPAEYYHRVEKGLTKVGIKSYSGAEIKTAVSFKSPEISPELRTFQIKCQVSDPNKRLVLEH